MCKYSESLCMLIWGSFLPQPRMGKCDNSSVLWVLGKERTWREELRGEREGKKGKKEWEETCGWSSRKNSRNSECWPIFVLELSLSYLVLCMFCWTQSTDFMWWKLPLFSYSSWASLKGCLTTSVGFLQLIPFWAEVRSGQEAVSCGSLKRVHAEGLTQEAFPDSK